MFNCNNKCDECPIFFDNLPEDRAERVAIYSKWGLCVPSPPEEDASFTSMRKLGLIK